MLFPGFLRFSCIICPPRRPEIDFSRYRLQPRLRICAHWRFAASRTVRVTIEPFSIDFLNWPLESLKEHRRRCISSPDPATVEISCLSQTIQNLCTFLYLPQIRLWTKTSTLKWPNYVSLYRKFWALYQYVGQFDIELIKSYLRLIVCGVGNYALYGKVQSTKPRNRIRHWFRPLQLIFHTLVLNPMKRKILKNHRRPIVDGRDVFFRIFPSKFMGSVFN